MKFQWNLIKGLLFFQNIEELIEKTVPAGIRHREDLKLDEPLSKCMQTMTSLCG